jgi:hypothetical protein
VHSPKEGWYRRLRANPDGEVRDGQHHILTMDLALTAARTDVFAGRR